MSDIFEAAYDRLQTKTNTTQPEVATDSAALSGGNVFADAYERLQAGAVKSSLTAAVQQNPERAARALALSHETNTPVSAIADHLDEIDQAAQVNKTAALLTQHPVTRKLFADPAKAAVAHDDTESLTAIEQLFKFQRNNRRALAAGYFGFGEGAAGVLQAGAEHLQGVLEPIKQLGVLPVNPAEPVADLFNSIRKNQTAWRKRFEAGVSDFVSEPGSTARTVEGGVYSGFESLMQNALTVPLAFASGQPELALSGMAASTGGQSYGKARDAGLSPSQASIYAAADAAIEYSTEKMGMDNLFFNLKSGSPVLKTLGGFLAREMPGEQAATALQDVNEWLVLHPEKSLSDYLVKRPDAALQTAIATVVGGGGQVAIMKAFDSSVQQASRARDHGFDAEFLAVLSKVAQANKVRSRSVQTFGDFVKEASEGSGAENVYLDAKVLHQSGLADDLMGMSPSAAEQYASALATGGDVRIPMDEYLSHVAGSEIDAGLLEHLRVRPEDMSRYESDVFMQQFEKGDVLQAEMEKALGVHDGHAIERAVHSEVRADILRQLNEVGRTKPAVNEAYADLAAAFFHVMGRRMGADAGEMYKRFPLKIRSEGSGRIAYGQFAGAGAATADLHHLHNAKARLAAGEDAEAVRKETGWHAGADGKWRFEINDSDATLKPLNEGAKPGVLIKSDTLDNIIDHQALFAAYPGLRGLLTNITVNPNVSGSSGKFVQGTLGDSNEFGSEPEINVIAPTKPEALSVLLHEIQHAIQQHEGFSKGGSAQSFEDQTKKPALLQSLEDVPYAELTNDERKVLAKLRAEFEAQPKLTAQEQYLRLAGEVEARNTQNRVAMNDAERAQIAPERTQDIKNSDVIVLFNGQEMNSAPEPANANQSILQQNGGNRGAYNPENYLITLLKDADLSTFLHELGHFYLETLADLAAHTDAPADVVADFERTLEWFGVQGGVSAWHALSFEQKTGFHEQFARGFEKYLFEGHAPSLEMAGIFSRFVTWLKKVYGFMARLNVQLSDDVRGVFDRLIASDEQIALTKQAQSMLPAFRDAAEGGMTEEEFAAYQSRDVAATETAEDLLGRRAVHDLQWVQHVRSRVLKRLQAEADDKRRAVRREVRMEVLGEPVYQAWRFLTAKLGPDDKMILPSGRKSNPDTIDPGLDSLFTAIAKLGGLNRDEVEATWGVERGAVGQSGVFGKPVLRKTGGKSIDHILEGLAQYGYIVPGEEGALPNQLKALFDEELRGNPQYSAAADFDEINRTEGLAGGHIVNPAGLGAGRFDLNSLKQMFLSDDVVAKLEAAGMTARNGLHPDIVASLPGMMFGSGDELVQALNDAPAPMVEIERRTDERMLELYGDISSPEALRRAADLAIHNEVRARLLKTEADALAKAVGKKRVMDSAAREFAAQIIARLRVRDLRHGQYAAAEQRAALALQAALRTGKMDVAAAESRNQLFNHYAAKTCLEAIDEIDKMVRYFAKFQSRGVRGLIATDYSDQIQDLLERVGLRPLSVRDANQRRGLQSWIEGQRAIGKEPNIPEQWLNEAYKINYRDMTVEELRELHQVVAQIDHLGRMKNKLLKSQKARTVSDARGEIVESINKHAGGRSADTRTPTDNAGKLKKTFRGILAAHFKISAVAKLMDGGLEGGAVWEYVIRPLNIQSNWKVGMIADLSKKLDTIMQPVHALGRMQSVIHFPDLPKINQNEARWSGPLVGLGKPQAVGRGLNRIERLAVAFNSGNASNLQRMMAGEKWNYQQIGKVWESLTLAEWEAVQQVWDLFESLRPEIAAKERRVYGVEPEWLKPLPFTVKTADGKIFSGRGGYYPVKFDPAASQKASENDAVTTAKEQMKAAFTSATTRRSFTKARVEEVHDMPLRLDWAGLFDGLNDVVNDLAFHECMIDMNQLFHKDGGVDQAMRSHYGPEAVQIFKDTQKDIAGGEKYLSDAVGRAFSIMRQYIGLSVLGFRVISGFNQITGFVQSAEVIGRHWVAEGIKLYVGREDWTRERVHELSGFMANRGLTQFRDLNDARNKLNDDSAVQHWLNNNGYYFIIKMQELVDIPTWIGAYCKALEAGNDDNRAVDLADQAVKDSQGSGMVMDQTQVERVPWLKMFTVFQTFSINVMNLAAVSGMSNQSAGKKAATFLNLFVMAAVYTEILKALLVPGDDDKWGGVPKRIAGSAFSNLMSSTVLTREFSPVLQELALGNSFDYNGPTGLKLIPDAQRLAEQARQGEFDDGFRKALVAVLGDVGRMPGALQINESISGAEALATGQTSNPAALVFGVRR